MDKNSTVLRFFGGDIQKALSLCGGEISEIRLRAGRPLCVTCEGMNRFVSADGIISDQSDKAILVSADEIRRTFEAVCRYSVHSFQGRISQGFVTVSGGHRVGLSGTAVYSADGRVENIRHINGLNFRIARQIRGAADEIIPMVLDGNGGGLTGVLICGEPCSGKTTVLRDLCRQIGDRVNTALIDERGEIAAESGGVINNNVGMCTDVYSGFSKADGIRDAVRSMSPMMLVCDEIGSEDDLNAIEYAYLSGVRICAAIHSAGSDELMMHGRIREMTERGIFGLFVFMKDRRPARILSRHDILKLRQTDGRTE